MATYTNNDIALLVNGSYGSKMNKTANGSAVTNIITVTNGIPRPRPRAKCVYMGKVKNSVSCLDILADRIVLVNIHNSSSNSKFNITIPYIEITALRYCNEKDISIFVIQPIVESYIKLSNWLQNNTNSTRIVPENFIMIHFENYLNSNIIENLKRDSKEANSKIRLIEIRSDFAHSYLNTPNKQNSIRLQRLVRSNDSEVIHIDDDDDDETELKKDDSMLNRQILKYPENDSAQILMIGTDLNYLRDGQYLNDNIMNFYLKYYQHNLCQNESILDRTHIYDTLFSNRLLQSTRKRTRVSIPQQNCVAFASVPFNETYQRELKRWTKDVDIFSKDFLIIPLHKDYHWFLAILCYIGNLIPTKSDDTAKDDNSDSKTKPKPTIIFMDSLNSQNAGNIGRSEITRAIYQYLEQELLEKRKNVSPLPKWNNSSNYFLELHPKVPQQNNYYDCGLFVLEYIEKFLADPDKIYHSIVKDSTALEKWFLSKSLETKRARIRQIILNLLPPEEAVKLEAELMKLNLEDSNKTHELH